MALTAQDISQIKLSLTEVIDPRFDETNRRIVDTDRKIDSRFSQLKSDVDRLAEATNRKFHTVFTDVSVIREDLHVMRQMVTEYGYRLSRIENEPGE